MLNEAGGPVLVEYPIGLFGKYGVDAVGEGKDAVAVRRDENLKRDKGTRAKVGFRRGENIGEFAEDVTQGRDD